MFWEMKRSISIDFFEKSCNHKLSFLGKKSNLFIEWLLYYMKHKCFFWDEIVWILAV